MGEAVNAGGEIWLDDIALALGEFEHGAIGRAECLNALILSGLSEHEANVMLGEIER